MYLRMGMIKFIKFIKEKYIIKICINFYISLCKQEINICQFKDVSKMKLSALVKQSAIKYVNGSSHIVIQRNLGLLFALIVLPLQ